jgi:hypothetical protein
MTNPYKRHWSLRGRKTPKLQSETVKEPDVSETVIDEDTKPQTHSPQADWQDKGQ